MPSEKRCILIVDDDKNLLVSLGDLLEFKGFHVLKARSAEEALEVLKGACPDLILLDITMPGMGGIGFLKAISSADGVPRCPVVVLTARSAMEAFFGSLPVEGFLAKPCSEDKLIATVRDVLARRMPKPAPPGARRSRKRVMLAENDPSVSSMVRRDLEAGGYDVDVVTNGGDVLDRLVHERPDILVVKELLPRIAGSDLVPLIQALGGLKDLPIVLYDSTQAGTEDRHALYGAPPGVSRFLVTSDGPVILRAVREALKG